ncbi:MAG: HDIG domain-containing protein [Actinobacteria bacterium]|nr:HDIG domain-containing protein [Actinomycetota bacterium]
MTASLDCGHAAFFAQGKADQRHGYAAGRRVGSRPELIRAALLHDIGKRHANLSPVGRAFVTAAAKVGLPVGRRGGIYLDHGRLGAEELRALGAEPPVIDFAANHHGERPASISPADWATLVKADR